MKGFSSDSFCYPAAWLGDLLDGECYFYESRLTFPSALLAKIIPPSFVASRLASFVSGALRKRSTSSQIFAAWLSGGGFQSALNEAYCLELSYHQYAQSGERMPAASTVDVYGKLRQDAVSCGARLVTNTARL